MVYSSCSDTSSKSTWSIPCVQILQATSLSVSPPVTGITEQLSTRTARVGFQLTVDRVEVEFKLLGPRETFTTLFAWMEEKLW